ncbi:MULTISPECIES: ATP-binding cassette domain-containing protein [Acidianus]|uniref:Molybdate/tungstate import ATP-binding protein WtpC n=1 Tax=Candidatus Acidianus copahuensis TaxID=1160895 RepID=A0A031LP96_9CREN|nr:MULTISPECIES: ATP-binding cassette domain-containing protein [Acidianus]EZQ06887.1 sugar ABC transporter ATP-binding protein [Candidatus Acidianus copahuensis]NON62856.1 ABC transporter ATP-binding protein [Acidianus sp. RZ1]
MIEVDIKKKLGEFNLVASMKEKGIISITGKNGSGKTTLLRIIAGFLPQDSGYIKLNGKDITKEEPEKRETVLISQGSIIPGMSVEKHLLWGAKIRKVDLKDNEIEEVKELLGINFNGNSDKLSLGQKGRLAISTALLSKPRLLLIDEVFANINNKEEFIKNLVYLLNKYNIEMIFISQDEKDSVFANSHLQMEGGKLLKIF